MSSNRSSYGQILGSTTLFGGVQLLNIIFSIIKTKAVAVFIGANGIGVLGLFNSSIGLLSMLSSFGLDRSAVREISVLKSLNDNEKVLSTIKVVNTIMWFIGFFGAIITIVFAGALSKITFDSDTYTYEFIWLALAVLFNQLTNGKKAILQGTRKLKALAKANLLGSLLGVLISLPLYFFLELKGIVPSIVTTSVIIYLVYKWSASYGLDKANILNLKYILAKGRPMFRLGIAMNISSVIHVLTLWMLQVFISRNSNLEELGYYNAGMIIINSYIGMIFNAMGTDYFPRLSAIHDQKIALHKLVSDQAKIAVLLITPLVILFFMFDFLIIHILYTKEFLVILGLVTFGLMGTLFKAVSFSLGYVIIARGDAKVFLVTGVVFNALMFIICAYGYLRFGLTGLGAGLMVYYFLHLVMVKSITYYRYDLKLDKKFYQIFAYCLGLSLFSYAITFIKSPILRVALLTSALFFSLLITYRELNKQMDIKHKLINLFKKNEEQ